MATYPINQQILTAKNITSSNKAYRVELRKGAPCRFREHKEGRLTKLRSSVKMYLILLIGMTAFFRLYAILCRPLKCTSFFRNWTHFRHSLSLKSNTMAAKTYLEKCVTWSHYLTSFATWVRAPYGNVLESLPLATNSLNYWPSPMFSSKQDLSIRFPKMHSLTKSEIPSTKRTRHNSEKKTILMRSTQSIWSMSKSRIKWDHLILKTLTFITSKTVEITIKTILATLF